MKLPRSAMVILLLTAAGFVVFVGLSITGLMKDQRETAAAPDANAEAVASRETLSGAAEGGAGIVPAEGVTPDAGEGTAAGSSTSDAAPPPDPLGDLQRAHELEQTRRRLERELAEEAALLEADRLARDGSPLGAGSFQPEPPMFDRGSGGEAGGIIPAGFEPGGTGLGASLDPALAAITGPEVTAGGEGLRPVGQGASVSQGTGPDVGYLAHGPVPPRGMFELKKGTVIPAALITELNSDLPGSVSAQVRAPVYDSVTGGTLLVPQGARLFGTYDADVDYGQDRAVVLWTHLVFPDGSTLLLEDQLGTDPAGRSGFADRRKGNFLRLLAGNLLFSVVDAGEGALQARIDEEITGSRSASDVEELVATLRSGAAAGGGGSAAAVFNSKVSQMQPTLVIRAGYRFNVLVAKDIVLEPWNG